MKRYKRGKAGKARVMCPECKEKSASRMRHEPENDNSHESYHCEVCKEHWHVSEVIVEEYKTAVFIGNDGKAKFIALTDERKKKLAEETDMWNKYSMRRSRDEKGLFTGSLSKKDSNLLKRLRK